MAPFISLPTPVTPQQIADASGVLSAHFSSLLALSVQLVTKRLSVSADMGHDDVIQAVARRATADPFNACAVLFSVDVSVSVDAFSHDVRHEAANQALVHAIRTALELE